MSILKPLDNSGNSGNESCLYVGRNNRGELHGTVNPSNMMRVQYRPELGGISLNPRAQVGSPTAEIYPQSMEQLSKRSLSDMERQPIFRAVKQRNHGSPVLPLRLADSVVLSVNSNPISQGARSMGHRQQQNGGSPHTQGFFYSPASMTTDVLDSTGDSYSSFPALQAGAALEKPLHNENFAQNCIFNLPKFKLPEEQSVALDASAKMNDDPEGIRHRLQELERELLSDNDDSVLTNAIGPEESPALDREWADTIQNLLFEDTFQPPTFLEDTNAKNKISTSPTGRPQQGNQEHSTSTQQSNYLHQENTSLASWKNSDVGCSSKQLLVECAAAMSDAKYELASIIIRKLSQMVSIYGDPMQRLAAYMVEGLIARLGLLTQGSHGSLKWKQPTSRDLSAIPILSEVWPYFKFGYMAANGAILEACKDEEKVHIIDFEIGQGSQYVSLIRALAARNGGPPKLRITAVDDPESNRHLVGGTRTVGKHLVELAGMVSVPLQFHNIVKNAADIQPWMLNCRPDEGLAVNFAFQLGHVPDESVSTRNPRDQLLRLVKSLNPKVVTVVEKELNTNTAPFLPRFVEALSYYSAAFESLDITLPRESRERIKFEKQCLAQDIVNIIACEGEERTERYEVAGKWRARMMMAGFTVYPLTTNVNETIKSLLESCCDSYRIKREREALQFGWLDKILIVASAWH